MKLAYLILLCNELVSITCLNINNLKMSMSDKSFSIIVHIFHSVYLIFLCAVKLICAVMNV